VRLHLLASLLGFGVAPIAAAPLAEWDLDADDGGLVPSGDTEQWAWGAVESGPAAGWDGATAWGTVLGGVYLNDSVDYLQLPSVDLSGADHPVLAFHHWFDIDPDGDGGWVEVHDGNGWSRIEPIYGYPDPLGFTGTSPGWTESWFDLSLVDDAADVRFAFSADGSVARAGWYLDDLRIEQGDVAPPQVEALALPEDTQDLSGPYAVGARVVDDLSAPTATLLWWTEDDPETRSAAMLDVGGDQFEGDIPAAEPGTRVYWTVRASDGTNEVDLDDGPHSFRVYLAAPTGLSGPSGRVADDEAALTWDAPDSPHAVTGYRVYRDGALVGESEAPAATVALWGDDDVFEVSALYDTPLGAREGDPSDPLVVNASIPTIDAISPASAFQGDELRVEVTGSYLLFSQDDAELALGEDCALLSVEVLDVDRARFTIALDDDAAPGVRDLVVRSGSVELSVEDGFEVLDGATRPALVSVQPDSARQGDHLNLVIQTSDALSAAPTLDLGEGVVVESVEYEGTVVIAQITVLPDAPVGSREARLDDGQRVLGGVDFRVRDYLPPPSRTCSAAGGGPAAAWLVLGALWARRRQRARALPRPKDRPSSSQA
jgi:uncharacterized protein (TIGR03382 family)